MTDFLHSLSWFDLLAIVVGSWLLLAVFVAGCLGRGIAIADEEADQ